MQNRQNIENSMIFVCRDVYKRQNQQKSSRMMAVINPEVQKIQKKYRNKRDQASMMKQQEEIQQVYDKYGTSMMGGCLPMLIQMPLLFALYPVIYDIERYRCV